MDKAIAPAKFARLAKSANSATSATSATSASNGYMQPPASSKLAFVEALLATDTLVEASQLGVDWLTRHLAVRQVAVALADLDRPAGARLVVTASHGLAPAALTAISIDLDDRDHPFIQALAAARASTLSGAALDSVGLAFASRRCTAFPLPFPARRDRDPVGIVLLNGVARDPEIKWLLGVLGRKLVDLRNLRVLATTERRLDRERALLQSILKAVPDPVLLTDPEGRLVVANSRAELYFASEEEESEGRRRAVALNNMLFSAALSRHAIEGTEFERRELPIVDPSDGSDRLFELMSAPIVTPDGPGIVSVLRNVTDLQLAAQEIEDNYRKIRGAEAQVRAERDRLDVIIDSVADPIVVTDANGAMIMTNAPAQRLFTASPNARIEETLRVRANDAHFSSHVSNLFFIEATGRFRGELGLADPKTGAPVPVEAISGKIVSEMGDVTAIVTILHDQTEAVEKARLYEELKLASDLLEQKVRDATAELVTQNELLQRQALELEAASSAKSQFLANMSHEFRTPLNAILGYTSMLLQGVSGPLSPSVTRQLGRVDSNGKHLLTIINDILDIARIEAGKMPLNLTRFALGELVEEVLAEVDPLIKRAKLTVKTELGRSLPTLRSDRSKVKQILMNLISNALKFTPSGSVTVSARLGKRKNDVLLAVTDTGIGISRKDQEAVFQDFRQVDNSPTRQYGGTGLGLAICRRLAAHLGGDIELVSKLRKGSTFTLVLPVKGVNR
ncbi:MAG: sensory box histidine kinase [Myxococcaceae bacterium]|nr:sensory box histidine kinase [Myxococcaceae bacterium]